MGGVSIGNVPVDQGDNYEEQGVQEEQREEILLTDTHKMEKEFEKELEAADNKGKKKENKKENKEEKDKEKNKEQKKRSRDDVSCSECGEIGHLSKSKECKAEEATKEEEPSTKKKKIDDDARKKRLMELEAQIAEIQKKLLK